MASAYTGVATAGNVVGIPTNILKVHTNELLFEAMPAMRYDQFAVVKTDLEKQPGDTIVFSKYANITRGGTLNEQDDIELKSMSKTAVNISVTEYGNGIGITGKLLSTSFMDEMKNASVLLGRDYADVTDCMLRDAAFSTTNVYYAGGAADRNSVAANAYLKTTDVDAAVEQLALSSTLKFVDANGEFYVGIFSPHQLRYLKADMTSIKQYAYPELIFKGEVGEYNGVRFVETANVPNGGAVTTDRAYVAALNKVATAALTAAAIYKGVIFGDRAYGWAVALPVELREDPGYSNFGRKRGIAWYAIQGAGKIRNESAIIIETA